jgi:hypothetical protein
MTNERSTDNGTQGRARGTWTVIVGGGAVALLAVGWFILSHFIIKTSAPDAVEESLGVAFALLVVASIIGAIGSSHQNHG